MFHSRIFQQMACCLLAAGVLCNAPKSNAQSIDDQIATLEQRYLGAQQPSLNITQRLAQLEEAVFGQADTKTDNPSSRLLKLTSLYKQSLPVAPLPMLGDHPASQQNEPSVNEALAPATEDYPMVTALEQKILQRTFTQHPLPVRLDRLEFKLYKTSFAHQPLAERMDQLVRRFPEVLNASQGMVSNNTSPSAQAPVGSWSQQSKLYQTLGRLEMAAFQQTYPDKTLSERVTQLEHTNLGISYPNDTLDIRLKRLLLGLSQ